MSARFRHDYRQLPTPLPVEDAVDYDSVDSLLSYVSDLRNDIHPIFSPINFPGADYKLLRPALQLASLLIDNDCLLEFWHAVFFGLTNRVDEDAKGERWHWAYFRPRPTLTAKDRAMTRLRLRTLSHMFKFYRDEGLDYHMKGVCDCTDRMSLCHMLDRGDVQGVVESIRYSDEIYRRICMPFEFGGNLRTDDDLIEHMQHTYFEFAILVVHEVAHAAVTVQAGISEPSMSENNAMSEHGFDWEHHIFGGLLTNDGINSWMTEWPSPSVAKFYLDSGYLFWTQKRDWGTVETRWSLPEEYVESMFSPWFWNDEVAAKGASALKVPRVDGQRVKVGSDASCTPFGPHERGADRFDGVPEGWWADGDRIYPFESDSEVDTEGMGRLMRINIEGIWGDEDSLHYSLQFPALPPRPAY